MKPKTFIIVGTFAFITSLAIPLGNHSLRASANSKFDRPYNFAKNHGASDGIAKVFAFSMVFLAPLGFLAIKDSFKKK
ncbi:hypothetical protein [Nostoc sp. TCL26-01]|uniref:hypothetical protein n=1 Tax=Nostoc sp. TCL26-01 TaxID=2576904 RepID=UPI0015BEFD5D|nr:hypothetical protein [Nostoc sp. TCL26-01]QLE57140.1 hypothetical protein FD725_17390 [Nostoc sp. TCL26-01]